MRLLALFLLAALLGASTASGADDTLAPVSEALAKVRATRGANKDRDAGPELTLVKDRLRAWVESQLPPAPTTGDTAHPIFWNDPHVVAGLSQRLSKTLDGAGLTCGLPNISDRCTDRDDRNFENDRGYLGPVEVSWLDSGRYLLVETMVGVRCGFDDSAYVYQRGKGQKWTLLLATEQNRYDEKAYAPQAITSVQVSPSRSSLGEPAEPPLVLTLGYSLSCSGSWQVLYSRLWRASRSMVAPPTLIDRQDTLFIGNESLGSARLRNEDLLIEFDGSSIDADRLVRDHVRHYLIKPADKLERIAPVALNPDDFVDEWINSDWAEAAHWIAPGASTSLEKFHRIAPGRLGQFDGTAKRCRADPTLWQVNFSIEEAKAGKKDADPPSHFLVRWMAPYRFTLIKAQRTPFPRCDVAVEMPDNIGTLFPASG